MSGSGLAGVASAVADACAADLSGLDGADLIAGLADVEASVRRLDGLRFALLAEVDRRRRGGEFGATTTAELLATSARLDVAQARQLADSTEFLAPRATLGGEPLPPLLPLVAAAAGEGTISAGHVHVLRTTMDRLPSWMTVEQVATAERFLVDRAQVETVGQLRRTAAVFLARLRPDDPPPPDAERPDRHLSLTCFDDGTGRLTGRLSQQATAALSAVLDALAAPAPAQDGTPDPRTAGQRRHDAMVEACSRLLTAHRSGRPLDPLPASGGLPVTIVVRTTAPELEAARRTVAPSAREAPSAGLAGAGSWQLHPLALTDRGTAWPLADVLAAAPRARVVPVAVDADGALARTGAAGSSPGSAAGSALSTASLWQGRRVRCATRAQRLALVARDGGCCFPGCEAPATWCEAHHVVPWQAGGRTDVDQLVLLCRRHHRAIGRDGWTLRMRGGLPEWLPPPWIDPQRRPRRPWQLRDPTSP